MIDTNPETVESHGEPVPESRPIDLPCKGPACDKRVLTYQTDADVAASDTVQVLRFTPETGDDRLVRYWFCSPECRTAFIEHDNREETLYDNETPDTDQQEAQDR